MTTTAADGPSPDVSAARAVVRALGKQWSGEVNARTAAAYAELQRRADRAGLHTESDVAYGDHALQQLDIVWAEDRDQARPGVVYLHGGGFVRGDKSAVDDLIYGNVAAFFARHGSVGINANYRLAPDATWPAGAEDVRAVLSWWREHAVEYGGDPRRVFLMGNSAGAAHVATYLWHAPSRLEGGPSVAGALLSSGAFAAEPGDAVYYGADPEENARRAPLGLLDRYQGEAVPIFLWTAQYDPPFIDRAAAAMRSKLAVKRGAPPHFVCFEGHNHVSHVMSLNSADAEVGRAVLEFLRRHDAAG